MRIFMVLVLVWLSALSVVTYLDLRAYDRTDDRILRIEATGTKIGRWKCSHTIRQNVTIVTEASGAFQARMDACDEWKPGEGQ